MNALTWCEAVTCSPQTRRNIGVVDFTVTSSGQGSYVINGQPNPELKLTRGTTYTFDVVVGGHPFWIKTAPETGTSSLYDTGVTNNGASPGVVTFKVPSNAPSPLYYQCQFHEPMNGVLTLVDAVPASPVPAAPTPWGMALGAVLLLVGFAVISRARGRFGRSVAKAARLSA